MPDQTYLVEVAMVAATVTWSLRAVPFTLLGPLRSSALLPFLAERLPAGVMVILVIYTLRHVDFVATSSIVPAAAGVAVTAALHLWRSNMVLSLVVGTATYVTLASIISI